MMVRLNEDDQLLEKYNGTLNKVSNNIKNRNLIPNQSAIKNF